MFGKRRRFLKMMFIPSVTQACWQKTTFFFYFHFKWNPYRGKKDVLHCYESSMCVCYQMFVKQRSFSFTFILKIGHHLESERLYWGTKDVSMFPSFTTNQAPVAQVLQLKIYDRWYETKRLSCLLNRSISATFNY